MGTSDLPAWISAIASTVSALAAVATALGLVFTYWQVRLMKRMAITQFEDEVAREYRELAGRLPAKAILGEELAETEYEEALDEFIHYVDLCNEQIFLRMRRRISAETWANWRLGIKSNLGQPAFARAWQEIKRRSNNFEELRRLEADGFLSDPADWAQEPPNLALQRTPAAAARYGQSQVSLGGRGR